MNPGTAPVRLYPRGFLLSPAAEPLLDDLGTFRTLPLPGYVLQVDELAEVSVAVHGDDWVAVVGKAWPLSSGDLPSDGDPARHLLPRLLLGGAAAVESALYDVSGRYAVLARTGGRVVAWNDAAATRSVFFDAARRRVSSHYDILRRGRTGTPDRLPFGAKVGVNLLLDLTSQPGIGALVANHRLELGDGRQVRFHGNGANPALELSVSERLELVEDLWTEQLDRLVALGVPLVMSMSGGLDSRAMLAMAREHRAFFRSFTYTSASAVEGRPPRNRWEEVVGLDHELTQQMRELLPPDHHVIVRTPSAWAQANKEVLARNSTHEHGRWLLPTYLSITPDPRSVHYRGNLFEIGRCYWGTAEAGEDPLATLCRVLRAHSPKVALPDETVDAVVRERGAALGFDDLSEHYAVPDLAYWELRHARWYAQVLNETDTAFDTFTPLNARRLLDVLLSFPVEQRGSAWAQHELIHRNHPSLLFFGINDRADLYVRFAAPAAPEGAGEPALARR
ncbi:hypothetical protein GCM10009584_31550 [Ornithinimicrobium humiphilum]|uniref:Asparagine synthase (Glutamine-hydrolysing) n=1 Tax=Ornithinimicrobium humiphilum TaxID=125288 RepID=A0A543K5C8_9MICO|nr:hypothetical protein [Ornithinimicrobium humiphilum]TQM90281.1 hypothetical protein FB476_3234 [Ornithinimicrobium humiphilum]